MEKRNDEVLLRVEHLCQYFKMGNKELKAVDDVSFDIKKGEVFGLVGESGCGKTTTGRSIIKIYDCTSGSVYFKGQRICAGTRSYKDAIKQAQKDAKEVISALRKEAKENPSLAEKNRELIEQKKAELRRIEEENRSLIREAVKDHKNSDKEYARKLVAELCEKRDKELANTTDPKEIT